MNGALILVVEDNAATRKMMRLALEAEGYEVVEAEDGMNAVRLAAEREPAMVLLDCKLPDIDGFEVGRRLRALNPVLPVIAVTGWALTDEVLTAGFWDVLVKPVELSRLIEVVERYAGVAPPRRSTGKTVLLAEDDPMQRKLAQLALSSAGFEVIVAEDGESGLALAHERKPDAIVSDVLMPRMDGFALCKAVRSEPALSHVPIVLVSAHYVEAEDRALATRFGATRYVTRTGGFDAVVRALLAALNAPASKFVPAAEEELQAEHLRRIGHQLERQASIGVSLARRASLQSSALAVLDGLSDSLARQVDPERALGDTLSRCLDAAGMSLGAILLRGPTGKLAVEAQVGPAAALDWEGHASLLRHAVIGTGLMIPSEDAGDEGSGLLSALGAASALIVPILARGQTLGVLVLASNGSDLAGAEGESAVRAARSVAMQLGQALALSRMFSKLTAAEQRYRALLEHAHDAISISTPSGVVLEVNRQMELLLGLPRAQVVGRHFSDFAVQGGALGNGQAGGAVVVKGAGAIPVVHISRPDGSVAQVELSSAVVEVGGETCVLNIGRDVSDRLRLEGQLRQSQKMDAIGRLAGGIAHDFNNLLSVILSYGEILLREMKPDEPLRDDVEQIRKAGSRAADLTRQLLMFSRQQVTAPKVVDLNEALGGVDKMLRRILGADVELVLVLAPRLGRVRIDPGSLEQVIMNLAVNARDAMPAGGRLMMETANVLLDEEYARAHHGVTPGRHVLLAISDTGCGMDKPTQARIFEPFFTTKDVGRGTGLGLSTVFGIAQQCGGSVWVYSEPGKGSTFKVYLPRVDAAVDSLRPIEAPLNLRGTETILLVEDDDQVRAVASGMLRKSGYEVLDARNPGEAVIRSEGHKGTIHLLLSDVIMPLASGPELASRLVKARPETKVLFMSGYTNESVVRNGILDARFAYLQKPITLTTLTTKVREVLDAEGDTGSSSSGQGRLSPEETGGHTQWKASH